MQGIGCALLIGLILVVGPVVLSVVASIIRFLAP